MWGGRAYPLDPQVAIDFSAQIDGLSDKQKDGIENHFLSKFSGSLIRVQKEERVPIKSQKEIDKEIDYKCSVCGKVFDTSRSLQGHYLGAHKK